MTSCQFITLLSITLAGCSQAPPQKIIHVCDWHYVPKEQFAADLRSANDARYTDEEIDEHYATFLSEVEQVQQEQVEELRKLIRDHGLKHVWIEGITDAENRDFEEIVSQVKAIEATNIPRLRRQLADTDELIAGMEARNRTGENDYVQAKSIRTHLLALKSEHREWLLKLGAAGKLRMSGELTAALPLDDEETHQAANPIKPDGTIHFDDAKIKAREEAMVKRLLAAKELVAVIVLGAGHDLSELLKSHSVEYVRVMPKSVPVPDKPH